MLRVAYLSHFYPPLSNAGIEQNTHGLASALRGAGHTVRVLCVGNWAEGEDYWQGYTEDEWQGVPVRRLNINWRKATYPNQYLYDNPAIAAQVEQFLQEYEPDVVHITSMYTLSASVVQAVKQLNLPSVFTLSDFWSICPRHTLMRYDGSICDGKVPASTCQDCLMSESRLYRMMRLAMPTPVLAPTVRTVIRHPSVAQQVPGMTGWGLDIEERRRVISEALQDIDQLIAPSAFIRDTILAAGQPLQITLSNYGNNLDWLEHYSPRDADGELHIGYTGQVSAMKGIHLLIEAFQACRFPTHVHLYIYGSLKADADYVAHLRQLAAGNPRIHFMGSFMRSELPDVLRNLDVLVVPSVWPEVAGLVVQEAFAARIPVLASRMGGLPEFVGEGRGGLLFNVEDSTDLQKTLTRVVTGGHEFLDSLRATIPPVRTSHDEMLFMQDLYGQLKAKRSRDDTLIR